MKKIELDEKLAKLTEDEKQLLEDIRIAFNNHYKRAIKRAENQFTNILYLLLEEAENK